MGDKTKIDWCDYIPKGKRLVTKQGYVLVKCPEHPNANKGRKGAYIFEHRLVMSNYLKRALTEYEIVHHINGNRLDNRIENLALMTNKEHMQHHGNAMSEEHRTRFVDGGKRYAASRRKHRMMLPCACGCGMMIETPDDKGRERKYVRGHNTKGTHWRWKKNGKEN